ncbi:hypothetical protein NMY22_g4100 [Coprinellus aureogranulatus]|nr:hypothetical protein NMY22_g4100 [Coprinellus aureogranulatus]
MMPVRVPVYQVQRKDVRGHLSKPKPVGDNPKERVAKTYSEWPNRVRPTDLALLADGKRKYLLVNIDRQDVDLNSELGGKKPKKDQDMRVLVALTKQSAEVAEIYASRPGVPLPEHKKHKPLYWYFGTGKKYLCVDKGERLTQEIELRIDDVAVIPPEADLWDWIDEYWQGRRAARKSESVDQERATPNEESAVSDRK